MCMQRFLVNKFPTIADAEEAYLITYIGPCNLSRPSTSARIPMLINKTVWLSPSSDENLVHLPGNVIDINDELTWYGRSTDDAEGIFAFLHGLLWPIFDEKDFHDAFPKNYRWVHQEMWSRPALLLLHWGKWQIQRWFITIIQRTI